MAVAMRFDTEVLFGATRTPPGTRSASSLMPTTFLSIGGQPLLRIFVFLAAASSFFAHLASAQYGTAPNGYYPENYYGSIFTGTVVETTADEVTLKYVKGKKEQVFVGRFENGCSVPRADQSGRKLTPMDIPKDTVLIAFFEEKTKKVDGKKVKENVIIAIAFGVWEGKKIPDDKKMVYPCSNAGFGYFRVF